MAKAGEIVFQIIRMLIISTASFSIAIFLMPVLIKFTRKIGLIKRNIRDSKSAPIFSKLHQHKKNTPTAGGIIIWFTVIFLALILLILSKYLGGIFSYFNFIDRAQTYLPLATLLICGVIGLFDDILGAMQIGPGGGGLRIGIKIILYTLVAVLGAWWFYFRLDWTVLYVPFLGYIQIGWFYIPLFIFIIVASSFSANETDGLDGLAGGVFASIFGAFSIIAFSQGKIDLAAFCGVIGGTLLAFLWFNIPPARFYMGETGILGITSTLCVVAFLTNSVFVLPIIGGLLVIEVASILIQLFFKKFKKKKIFLSTPVHHHLEAKGWPHYKITMRFWIISIVLAIIGVAIRLLG